LAKIISSNKKLKGILRATISKKKTIEAIKGLQGKGEKEGEESDKEVKKSKGD